MKYIKKCLRHNISNCTSSNRLKKIVCIIMIVTLLSPQLFTAFSSPPKAYEVTLLPETYQTVNAWGIFPCSLSEWWLDKYAAHTAIYRDMGINMVRIELRGECGDGDGNLIKEYMDCLAAHIQTAVDNGISDYLFSIWSPPAGMKTNNKIEGQNDDGTRASLLPEKEEAFCQYVVTVLNELKRRGLPMPKVFSIQNEPNNAFNYYQCCYYTLEQYKRVFKLMRKTLDENGYKNIRMTGAEAPAYQDTKMWFGEGFSELEQDKEFADIIDVFSSHSYHNPSYTQKQNIDDYVSATQKFPDKEVWQTEYSPAHNQEGQPEIVRALGAMRVFTTDMAWMGTQGWFYWLGWDPRYSISANHQEAILDGDGITGVNKSLIYQTLAKVWKNAPAGSKVMRLETDDEAVVNTSDPQSDMVAFSSGNKNVILFMNSSKEDKIYNFNGLNGSSVEVYTAVSTESGLAQIENRNLTGGRISDVFIPAYSINVIITQQKDKAPPKISYIKDKMIGIDGDVYVSRESSLELNIQLDEPSDVLFNKQRAVLDDSFSFKRNLNIGTGVYNVRIDARDKVGNRSFPLFLKFRYDPKYVAVILDESDERTSDEMFEIKGSVNIESEVMINDEIITPDDDLHFSHKIKLEQGENKLVLSATDNNKNKSADVVHTVYCDSVSPEIKINNKEFTTTDSEYVISGSVDEEVKYLEIGGKTVTVKEDLTFAAKINLREGDTSVKITASDLFDNITDEHLKLTFTKTAATPYLTDGTSYTRKAAGRININGILDEADWVIDNKANKVVGGSPTNIVNFGTLWDNQYLYIAARIYDDSLIFDDERVYQNDCIEIFINPDNSKARTYGSNDKQLFIGYGKGRGSLFINNGADYRTGWSDFEGGYTIEMAIPWESMGIRPTDGLRIGFDITNDDKNVEGGQRESVLTWAGNGDNWQSTANFGTLILTSSNNVEYNVKTVETVKDDEVNQLG